MRTKANRKRRNRWAILAGAVLLITALAIIFYVNIGASGDKSPDVSATDLPGGRAAVTVLMSQAQTPLPSTPEIDAITATLNEVAKPDELLILMYRKFILQGQIIQLENMKRQIEEVELLNEPYGGADPAEYERNARSMDDYGAVEAANNQQASNLHALYADMAIEAQKQSERLAMAHRIDCYFDARNSVLKGYGYYMVISAEKYGHDPRLGAAIAECESTCAHACHGFNAWGLGGSTNYRTFGSWEEGIDAMNKFLMDYNGVCLSAPYNYCEPPYPWVDNCNRVMNSI